MASLVLRLAAKSLSKRFPSVTSLSSNTVHKMWLEKESNRERLIILDTRPKEEWAVSHISGSRRVSPEAADVDETLRNIKSEFADKDAVNIVCYCSIGYRASVYATKLQKAIEEKQSGSIIKAYNLEAGLFNWANERKPMVDINEERTPFAHPFNPLFGKLLKRDLRCYSPMACQHKTEDKE